MPRFAPNRADVVPGLRFGRWTLVREVTTGARYRRRAIFRCDCGSEQERDISDVRTGHSLSCGCYGREESVRRFTTHGERSRDIVGGQTPEYLAWLAMKARCRNVNNSSYSNYGGRGIRVCDRWCESFEAFLTDVGRKPTPTHSLDRINNDGNYEPGNVRWATRHEQRVNQRPVRRQRHGL